VDTFIYYAEDQADDLINIEGIIYPMYNYTLTEDFRVDFIFPSGY